jgi:tetratricopeptide (TPR) repeat protein
MQEEHLYHIGGMEFPDWETPEDALQYSAVKLFMQSARRVRPGFELQAGDLKYVSRICRLVQGMPLGILLAAAWTEMLSPEEIALELAGEERGQEPSLDLDFLATDLRNVPERQRSMRAVFDHSWSLLPERQQAVMQALSVFRGGFTRTAAQEVTGASLRALMALVNRSMLHRAPTGRYEVHELLRQYAAEQPARSPAGSGTMQDRHAAYYSAALARWAADLKGSRQRSALEEIRADLGNARAAWDWAVDRGQVEWLDRAMEGLGLFYEWHGRYQEGEAAFRAAADRLAEMGPGTARRAWIGATTWQSHFSLNLGRFQTARQLLQRSLDLLEGSEFADQDVRREKAFVLWQLGWVEHSSGTKEQARQLAMQSLPLYRALRDRWASAGVLSNLGFFAQAMGQFDEAARSHREALAICRALGDQRGIARSLTEIGIALAHRGQFQEAERLIQESVTIERELGDRIHYAHGLSRLAHVSAWKGEFVKSLSLSEEGWSVLDELGASVQATNVLSQLGSAKAHLGQYDQAHVHLQQALALARVGGQRWAVGATLCFLGHVALAKEQYVDAQQRLRESADVFQKSGDRSDVGWPLALLAGAARGLGRLPTARERLCEALQVSAEIRDVPTQMYALPVAALLLADLGEAERAVEIYALASRYGFVANSRLWEDIAGREIAALAATLPPDVVAAAQARGRARDLEATVKELLEGLTA